jgi:hypothetical protein
MTATVTDWIFVHRLDVRDAEGDPVTLWASTLAKVTGSADEPANTLFEEVIRDPGEYRAAVFSGSRQPGVVSVTRGGVVYGNPPDSSGIGRFDAWVDYATDGGKLTCWMMPPRGAFPADAVELYVAYVDGYPELTGSTMRLQLRGRERLLDRPVVTANFDPDLGAIGGVSLQAPGIPGARRQQIVMGRPAPIKPILTDDVTGVWFLQANPLDSTFNGGVPKVYDGGSPLTVTGGVDTGQGPGVCRISTLAGGQVVLRPVSPIRFELRAETAGRRAIPGPSTEPWTISDLAELAGITVGTLAPGSTDFSCGNRVVETETVRQVLQDVAAFEVASIGFDRLDRFYAKPIVPSFAGTPVFTLRDAGSYSDGNAEGLSVTRLAGLERRVWQLQVRAGRTTRSALAGVVDDTVRDTLSREPWMSQFTADVTFSSGPPLFSPISVLDTDPTAEVAEVEIIGHEFADPAERGPFAERFLALHGARCTAFSLETPLTPETVALGLLDCVALQSQRFGNRKATIVGVQARLGAKRIRFDLWSQAQPTSPGSAQISITESDETVGAGGNGAGSGATGTGQSAPAPQRESFYVPLTDKTSTLATGESTQDFIVPYALTLSEVQAQLSTVQASGSIFRVDIRANGVSILSTKITIDNTERSSITAATPPVISAPSLAKGDRLTFHIEQVGTGGKGPAVTLIGTQA